MQNQSVHIRTLGNLKAGEFFCVQWRNSLYGMIALKNFNFFEEQEKKKIVEIEEPSSDEGDGVDISFNPELVDPVERDVSPEELKYCDKFSLELEVDYKTLKELAEKIPDLGTYLNTHQISRLVEVIVKEELSIDRIAKQYLQLAISSVGSAAESRKAIADFFHKTFITPSIAAEIKQKEIEAHKSHGFFVWSVAGKPSLGYTTHAEQYSYELVCYCNIGTLSGLITHKVALVAIMKGIDTFLGKEFTLGDYSLKSGEKIRFKIDTPPEEIQKECSGWAPYQNRAKYQILVADENNLLPGEEGYDDSKMLQLP